MNAIADSPPSSAKQVNLRAFLAGGTATVALIAGAVIVFVALATYVAFEGLPGGGDEGASDTVFVGSPAAGAPEAAAAALADAPGAVAAAPAAATPVAPPPGAVLPAPGATPATTGAPTAPNSTTGDGGGSTGTGAPAPTAAAGPLGGAVGDVQNATDSLGLDLPLQEVTDPITQPLDKHLNDALNDVGGALGNPNLGNQINQGLSNVTGRLLGPGGATDQLLNP